MRFCLNLVPTSLMSFLMEKMAVIFFVTDIVLFATWWLIPRDAAVKR